MQYGAGTMGNSLELGRGFDPAYPSNVMGSPYKSVAGRWVNEADTPIQLLQDVSQVTSISQLMRESSISLKLDGKVLFGGSVSAAATIARVNEDDSTSLSWRILVQKNFGKYELISTELSDSAKALLTNRDGFLEAYGSEVVTIQDRGCSLVATFTLRASNSYSAETLSSKLKATGSFGPYTFSVDGSFASFMKHAVNTSAVEVTVAALGGGSQPPQPGVMTKYSDFEDWLKALNLYLATFDKAHSVPLMHYTSAASVLGVTGTFAGLPDALEEAVLIFRQLQAKIDRLSEITDPDSLAYLFVSGNRMTEYGVSLLAARTLQNQWRKYGASLIAGGQVERPAVDDVSVRWPVVTVQVNLTTLGLTGDNKIPLDITIRGAGESSIAVWVTDQHPTPVPMTGDTKYMGNDVWHLVSYLGTANEYILNHICPSILVRDCNNVTIAQRVIDLPTVV